MPTIASSSSGVAMLLSVNTRLRVRRKFSNWNILQKYVRFVKTVLFSRDLNTEIVFFLIWSPLVRRHLFWPPSMVYISVIITHITHYKSCWTFCVGSYTYQSTTLPPSHHGWMNTEIVRYSNGWIEVGWQRVQYLNAIWILDSPTIWILDKWTPSCFLMYWFGIRVVGLVDRTKHFNRTF